MTAPKLMAMLSLQAPIEGDEALLHLAQHRLEEAGLGGELYPGSPEHLRQLLPFRTRQPCTAHLPRGLNLLEERDRLTVVEYARVAAGNLYGLILHDQKAYGSAPDETAVAFREIDRLLAEIPGTLLVFVEYAAGLEPEQYAGLFERCTETRHLSAAIDVGHVGIHVCRASYRSRFPGQDICTLAPEDPNLPEQIDAVQQATDSALPAVLALIERLAHLKKPLHFHLHDGHPLSTFSLFGVSDHLSFLQPIRLPFVYRESNLVTGIFGVSGLRHIVRTALAGLPARDLSFLLEMHPMDGLTPLREHAGLFAHWRDKANAERMNYWLDNLLQNAALVREACGESAAP